MEPRIDYRSHSETPGTTPSNSGLSERYSSFNTSATSSDAARTSTVPSECSERFDDDATDDESDVSEPSYDRSYSASSSATGGASKVARDCAAGVSAVLAALRESVSDGEAPVLFTPRGTEPASRRVPAASSAALGWSELIALKEELLEHVDGVEAVEALLDEKVREQSARQRAEAAKARELERHVVELEAAVAADERETAAAAARLNDAIALERSRLAAARGAAATGQRPRGRDVPMHGSLEGVADAEAIERARTRSALAASRRDAAISAREEASAELEAAAAATEAAADDAEAHAFDTALREAASGMAGDPVVHAETASLRSHLESVERRFRFARRAPRARPAAVVSSWRVLHAGVSVGWRPVTRGSGLGGPPSCQVARLRLNDAATHVELSGAGSLRLDLRRVVRIELGVGYLLGRVPSRAEMRDLHAHRSLSLLPAAGAPLHFLAADRRQLVELWRTLQPLTSIPPREIDSRGRMLWRIAALRYRAARVGGAVLLLAAAPPDSERPLRTARSRLAA